MQKTRGITALQVVALSVLALGLLVQVIPYGRNRLNPAVKREPNWPNAETRALAVRACFDCHSNESIYPRYSNIAPISWLVQRDIEEGRSSLNFSQWNGTQKPGEAGETISNGSMPPVYYVWLHPRAKLSDLEQQTLIDGLQATGTTGSR